MTSLKTKNSPSSRKAKKAGNKPVSIKQLDEELEKPRIGTFEEAPAFSKTNIYIRNGYRINHKTYKDAIWSLLTIHNESVNIWSHLIGAILFLVCIFYLAINM